MPARLMKRVARAASDVLAMLRRRLSLQMTALIFILFVCVVLAGLQTAYTLSARNRAIADSAMDTANLARSIAQHAEDTIRTSDAVLIGMVERLETDGRAPRQLDRLHNLFAAQVAALPQLKGLSYIDETGALVADSQSVMKKINLADRDYFQFHRDHLDRGPYIGAPAFRESAEKWVIPVSRRVDHKDGSFAGVAVAAIDMAYFQDFYDTFDLGARGSILLASSNGTLLVRRPFDAQMIGRDLRGGELFRDNLPKTPVGTAEIVQRADNVLRLSSYRKVDAYPLVAAVALAKDEVLADWRRDAWHDSIITAILVLILGTLGMRLTRQIARCGRAERAARQSEQRYRLLADHSTDLIVLIDLTEDKRLYVSPASRRLYDYEPEELVGGSLGSIVHPDDLDIVKAARQKLETTDHVVITHRARRKDGQYIWVEAGWQRLANAATGAPEVVVNVRDVTERVQIEDALRAAKKLADAARDQADAANEAKSQFLANMSHEIRTPMNGVLGMTHLLLGTSLSDEQLGYANCIDACGESLLVLINDILDLSKLESRAVKLERAPFDLPLLVENVVSMLMPRVREKSIEFTATILSAARGSFLGDPTRIRQVLTNLAANAIKFTRSGSVQIEISAHGEAVGPCTLRFDVIDTGIGISDAVLPRLFQKFTQADTSINREFGGSGLGLAISKQLVELMDGSIGASSKEGAGSRFWFEVPLERAAAVELPKPGLRPTQLVTQRSLRVLLVEDNAVNQQVARLILMKAGHRTDVVDSGRKAIAALQSESYDVVLMDIQMADVDGVKATTRIRALAPPLCDVPIIAMTAHALAGDRERYIGYGMDDYIAKPFDPPDLLMKIDRAATRARNAAPKSDLDTTPVPSVSSAFDPTRLDQLRRLMDKEKFSHMVDQFAESLESRISRVVVALERSNLAAAAQDVHDVISIAGNAGADRLCALARDLARSCRANDEAQCRDIFPVFSDAAKNALRALKDYDAAA